MADLKAFAEQLVNLTVKEVNELAQILKDEYGIEPAAAAVAVAAAAPAEAAAEKSTFDVILKSGGAAKLGVVKIVKEILLLHNKARHLLLYRMNLLKKFCEFRPRFAILNFYDNPEDSQSV